MALIGGLVTWLNRHGGCASRTKDRRRQDNFNDFNNNQDLESNKMGYNNTPTSNNNNNNNINDMSMSSTAAPISPFQRRLVPATGQSATNGYMNLGDDEYSETSTALPLMNQNQAVYHHHHPPSSQPGVYDYSKTEYNNSYEMDSWQQQQQQYYNPVPSPQNMTQMKPDTIDHKPNEI